MFINRKDELVFLNQARSPFFIVLYGRRRVGKTELLKQYAKGKRSVYFLSTQEVEKENMASFSHSLAESFHDTTLNINPLTTFKQVLEYLKTKEDAIVILDEFPYLVDANRAVPSLLQKYWDMHFKHSSISFILCGSSVSSMESEVLGRKSPLYGRRTGQWKVDPLLFKDAIQFFPRLSLEKQTELYAIIGGIPLYLEEMKETSLIKNIMKHIAQKGKLLYEEAEFLLKEEVREPKIYFSILKELARGKTRLSEIKNALGVESTLLTRYIDTLERLDIVERQMPVITTNKKGGLYLIKDNYVRFWFTFIFPHKKDLERGIMHNVENHLKKRLPMFIGHSFENICKEALGTYAVVGSQWGKLPHKPKGENQYEVDICAMNDEHVLFGECKWKDNVDPAPIVKSLREKTKHITSKNVTYAVFAKSFRTSCSDAQLYNLQDIIKMARI